MNLAYRIQSKVLSFFLEKKKEKEKDKKKKKKIRVNF